MSWQETVAKFDRRAHRKNGMLTISMIGSFRAMDDRRAAERNVVIDLEGMTHEEAVDEAIFILKELKLKARDLDRRIEKRRGQKPHERSYLYGD